MTWLIVALATNTVYAACVALVVVGLPRLLGVRRPSVLYLGWSLVLVRMVLPPSLASVFSLRSIVDRMWQWVMAGGEVTVVGGGSIPVGLEGVPPAAASMSPWTAAAFAMWLLGCVLVAFVLVRRFRWYRRVARTATEVSRPEVLTLTNAWRDRFHVTRPVRVVSSDRCLTPFASGLVRPVIFLPEAMFGWSNAALEPVIAHEMAHISRLDELWTVLANVVRAVHFFNPLAWVAVARLAANRELVCDERVLGAGGVAPDRYARSMLGAMQINLFGTARADVVLGLIDRKKGVAMRIERMRSAVRPRPLKPMILAVGVLAALLLVLPMGAGDAQTGGSATASIAAGEAPQQPGVPAEPEIVQELDGRPVYKVEAGGPVTDPVRLSGPNPEYPPEARAARVQGTVVIEATISEQGEITATKVLRGLPLGLSEAAEAAISQWKFEPSKLNDRPVPVIYVLTVRFLLDGGDEGSFSGEIQAGEDGNAIEELQRLNDRIAATLEREITSDIRVVRIGFYGGQLLVSVVAPDRSSVDAFAARLRANPAFDEVQLGTVDDREDGSVETGMVLHFSS